jgi:hypothetical protein
MAADACVAPCDDVNGVHLLGPVADTGKGAGFRLEVGNVQQLLENARYIVRLSDNFGCAFSSVYTDKKLNYPNI